MAKPKTLRQLRTDLKMLEAQRDFGMVKHRHYIRRKGQILRRIKERTASAATGAVQGK